MKKQSFIEGAFFATFAIILSKFLGMLYVIPFYSIVGETGSVIYSYAYNIYTIFLSISTAGIPNAISKLVSEYDSKNDNQKKKQVFNVSIQVVSILSSVCFLILMLFPRQICFLIKGNIASSVSYDQIILSIRAIAFSILLIPYLSVIRGYTQGHKEMKHSSASQVIEQIFRIAILLIGCYLIINVFHKDVSIAVAIGVFGAFVGGFAAIIYMLKFIFKSKKELSLDIKGSKDHNTEIIKKIIKYSIPFIIINLIPSIYNMIDMSIIMRTLYKLNYTGTSSEYIGTVISTWGNKLNSIVNAFATGFTISLIPNIAAANAQNDKIRVKKIFDKAIIIILFISLPCAMGLSILSKPVWTLFYSYNELGISIFKISILTAIFFNLFLIIIQTAQSLNYHKLTYIAIALGFLTNIILDAPLMNFCYKLGIEAAYGSVFATMIGYSLSMIIVLITLKKKMHISYMNIFIKSIKIMVCSGLMYLSCFLLKYIMPITATTKLYSIKIIAIYALVGGAVYIVSAYLLGLFKDTQLLNRFRKNRGNAE